MDTTTFADWPHLYRPGSKDKPVLLMLHGTGGNEEEIATLAAKIDPEAGVLAPRGPVREHGMLRWFRRLSEGVFDVDDVMARAGELAGFIGDARDHYGLNGRRIVAVGFSNGANIALATALLHPGALDRAIAFSGMYPLAGRDPIIDLTGSRLLVLNGDDDPMAPLPSVTTLIATLSGNGAQVEQAVRPGGHRIEASELELATDWLAREY